MRYLGLMLVFTCFVTYFMYFDWNNFFIPFTNWTLMLTAASLVASIEASNDTKNFGKDGLSRGEEAIYLQAKHHMLYTLSAVCNMICVAFYWGLLRGDEQKLHGAHAT
jgi:hypothetical protein